MTGRSTRERFCGPSTIAILCGFPLGAVALAAFEAKWRSVGRRVARLHLVDRGGQPLAAGTRVVRSSLKYGVVRTLAWCGVTLDGRLDAWWALLLPAVIYAVSNGACCVVRRDERSFHDLIVGSRSVGSSGARELY